LTVAGERDTTAMSESDADMVATNAAAFGCLTNVRKTFPPSSRKADEVVALTDVSYTLHRGELVALLGPSGCGKTTLLRIVAGLTRASAGRIEVDGSEVDGPRADFAFVFQAPTLLPWRSVLGNVLFPMEIRGRNDRAARTRALELLELVGLAGFARSRPHHLSGGMKQRVALCRALIQSPSLLLMDEPFGALDELTRMDMQDLLLNIRKVTGATVLFVTHSIPEAVYLADEILVFSARPGRVIDRIRTDLPYPRTAELRYMGAFTALERRASAGLGVLHPAQDADQDTAQAHG
jgi:NitT/TauT family transport system ATP-binding protein